MAVAYIDSHFHVHVLVDEQWPYEAAAIAFEAIPRTLAQNCGVNVIRTMTALQGKVRIFSVTVADDSFSDYV